MGTEDAGESQRENACRSPAASRRGALKSEPLLEFGKNGDVVAASAGKTQRRQQRLLLWVHSWADKQHHHQLPTTNVRIDLKIRNNNVNICKHFTNIFVPSLNDMNIFSQEAVEDFVFLKVSLFFWILFSRCISRNFRYAAVFFQFPAHSRSEAAGQIIHARMHTKRQKGALN